MLFDTETGCDRCGGAARAIYRVWISRYPKALDLLLCSHHRNKYLTSLDNEGYEVVELDELRPALTQ